MNKDVREAIRKLQNDRVVPAHHVHACVDLIFTSILRSIQKHYLPSDSSSQIPLLEHAFRDCYMARFETVFGAQRAARFRQGLNVKHILRATLHRRVVSHTSGDPQPFSSADRNHLWIMRDVEECLCAEGDMMDALYKLTILRQDKPFVRPSLSSIVDRYEDRAVAAFRKAVRENKVVPSVELGADPAAGSIAEPVADTVS